MYESQNSEILVQDATDTVFHKHAKIDLGICFELKEYRLSVESDVIQGSRESGTSKIFSRVWLCEPLCLGICHNL